MNFFRIIALIVFIATDALSGLIIAQEDVKPNFLLIVVDDLNDYATPFHNDEPQVLTPAIQQLADSGTVFMNAFASAPGCAPSRTSFLSGKDLSYTKVFNNSDYDRNFRNNFNEAKGNEEVFTLPEILKDSGGYYTFAINKIFHNSDANDFDKSSTPECEKSRSWNRLSNYAPYEDNDSVDLAFLPFAFDAQFEWGTIPDSMEYLLSDHAAADTAIQFLQEFAGGTDNTCGRPFFLALGIKYPHSNRYVPAAWVPEYFNNDLYAEPYQIPYNLPEGVFPYNGIVMPPQPDEKYGDYYALPEGGIAQSMAGGYFFDQMSAYYDNMSDPPEISDTLSDEEREVIIEQTVEADYEINYIAALQYADAQIGRVMQELYSHPELYQNTIVILISDHGFSLGEKRHWDKWCLWDTDIRIPMIIVTQDHAPGQSVVQPVSLLDLFPTVCELADVDVPTFSDGSEYLDGTSMVPLLEQPNQRYQRPVLTSYQNGGNEYSCNATFSVRDSRFHYIFYCNNTAGKSPDNVCEVSDDYIEDELYELGENRELDAHEWNNLAHDENYRPLVQFMQQWLPDSSFFLGPSLLVQIQNSPVDCFLSAEDLIDLSAVLFDTAGQAITDVSPFTFKWTFNLSPYTVDGINCHLPLDVFSTAQLESDQKLFAYLHVYDGDGKLVAFNLSYFYLHTENQPQAKFNVINDAEGTVYITNFEITGSYNSFWWDFGEGPMYYNQIPGPYSYSTEGIHKVDLMVDYGNHCSMTLTRFYGSELGAQRPSGELTVFPNPADESITISDTEPGEACTVSIYNSSAELVKRVTFNASRAAITLSTAGLSPGIYFLQRNNAKNVRATSFIVSH